MNPLLFSEQFETSFSKLKDKRIRKQIWKKILQLEKRAPLGKKLKGNPYWSIHVNKYRVIYQMDGPGITIADILPRKRDYKGL